MYYVRNQNEGLIMNYGFILIFFMSLLSQDKYQEFNNYWYTGNAEITSYDLKQARYDEIHQGHAVLIFVTEDFSKKKQVKLDYPIQDEDDKVSVLKLNFTKKFNTGIYPYSMMSSIFTPINIDQRQASLKVSTSSQEWCGHTFSQLNRIKDRYKFQMHSYFEQEGEVNRMLQDHYLEDEIWTMIRLNPDFLPRGKVKFIPGTFYSRLLHKEIDAVEAEVILKDEANDLKSYTIHYEGLNRSLKIFFKKSFPYQIEKWEETLQSGFGKNSKLLKTTATLKKRIILDYWSKNKNRDLHYRDELGLN